MIKEFFPTIHRYVLFCTRLNVKTKSFITGKDAEIAMHIICSVNNISVECTECDKHERKYSNHNGVRFYINRI